MPVTQAAWMLGFSRSGIPLQISYFTLCYFQTQIYSLRAFPSSTADVLRLLSQLAPWYEE